MNVLPMATYRSPADTESQSMCSTLQHSVFAPLMSPLCSVQEVLGDETADQVCCSFFGDGTCNVGESPSWLKVLNLARVSTSISQNHLFLPCLQLCIWHSTFPQKCGKRDGQTPANPQKQH